MIFLALLVIGFFFPPAWLALAVYAIYFMATKEKRRERIIKGYISNMVSRGVSEADIPELYYESAFGFAKANGAKFEEWEKPDIVFVFNGVEVNGRWVTPMFARLPNGGTRIELEE